MNFEMKTYSKKLQRGVTLIEMIIVVAIIGVLSYGASIGYNTYQKTKGANEGKIIQTALACAQTGVSAPSFALTTMQTVANKDCFPGDLTTGRGTAAATAASALNN